MRASASGRLEESSYLQVRESGTRFQSWRQGVVEGKALIDSSARVVQVVAVDAYAWLHRGVHACAWELACGGSSEKQMAWCMARVALLVHNGVKPLLVFDGGPLPAKASQEASRRARREEARARGMQCVREHRHDEARKWLAKAIDVTPEMARRLAEACAARWGRDAVDFIVAPYEADAQLAFACRTGEAAAVVSEDSDNLAYGTARVLFKLDADGTADEIVVAELFEPQRPIGNEIDVRGWTTTMFALMCALAGCDYVASLRGVGVKVAHRLVSRYRDMRRVLRAVRFEFGKAVPSTYERDVERAVLTFAHQTVYCRRRRATVHLAPLDDDVAKRHDDLHFLGEPLPDDIARGIAEARLHPVTRRAFDCSLPTSLVHVPLARATRDLVATNTIDRYFQPSSKHDSPPPVASSPETLTVTRRPRSPPKPQPKSEERASKKPKLQASRSAHFPPPPKFKPFKLPAKVEPGRTDDKENNHRDPIATARRGLAFRAFAYDGDEPTASHALKPSAPGLARSRHSPAIDDEPDANRHSDDVCQTDTARFSRFALQSE